MIARLKKLLSGAQALENKEDDKVERLELAAAALMVEAANMDDDFAAEERSLIAGLLQRRFELSESEGEALLLKADQAVGQSVEFYGWTRVIKDSFDDQERIDLMEMLWEIVYADGHLDSLEANMMRRLAGLLYVSDRDSGEARQRARQRLQLQA